MVDHRCCNFIGDGCLIGVGLLYTLLIVPKHVLVLVMPQKSLHSCSERLTSLIWDWKTLHMHYKMLLLMRALLCGNFLLKKRKKPRLDIWATFESQPMLHINLVLPNFFFLFVCFKPCLHILIEIALESSS